MQREMLHFVQHDKLSPYNHRLGVINARSERSVAVSLEVVVKFARFEDLKITFVNVLFQHVLPHPPTEWTNGSWDKISANREKNKINVNLFFMPRRILISVCTKEAATDA